MFNRIRLPFRALQSLALTGALVASQTVAFAQSNFSLRALDGATVSAAGLRGKVVVLAVGALWLPLSRTQVQGVQKLAETYANQGVEVFWVSTDSEAPNSKNYAADEQLRAFAAKHNLKVRVLRDPEGQVSRQLGADQVPAVIILDKQGKVAGAVGGLDAKGDLAGQLESRLAKLL